MITRGKLATLVSVLTESVHQLSQAVGSLASVEHARVALRGARTEPWVRPVTSGQAESAVMCCGLGCRRQRQCRGRASVEHARMRWRVVAVSHGPGETYVPATHRTLSVLRYCTRN
jgi:hypothetical protein